MAIKKALNSVLFNISRKFKTSKVYYEPQKLQLEITNACNLNCIECYRHSVSNLKIGYMKYDNFTKIINQFPYLKGISLFGTGESLLHREFFRMVEYLYNKNIKIFLTTNGTLLTEENIQKLVNYHIHLTISLDALTKNTYNKVSGKTTIPYERILNNIKFFRQYKADYKFTITFMMLNENYEEAVDFIKAMSELGVKKITLGEQQFYPEKKDFHIKDIENYKNILHKAIKVGEDLGVKVGHTKRDRTIWKNETKIEPCSFLWKQPFITWEGYWVLCCARPFPSQFTFGNILEKNFRELWFDKTANNIRKSILISNVEDIPFCKGCQHLLKN